MSVKKEKKKHLKEIRDRLAAVHKGARDAEIEDHNGKPFTSHNTPTPKTKYDRKKMKKPSQYDY